MSSRSVSDLQTRVEEPLDLEHAHNSEVNEMFLKLNRSSYMKSIISMELKFNIPTKFFLHATIYNV